MRKYLARLVAMAILLVLPSLAQAQSTDRSEIAGERPQPASPINTAVSTNSPAAPIKSPVTPPIQRK